MSQQRCKPRRRCCFGPLGLQRWIGRYSKYYCFQNIEYKHGSQILSEIYNCNFSNSMTNGYLKSLLKKPEWVRFNIRVWFYCTIVKLCFNPKFHEKKCLQSRQTLIKTVRLRLPSINDIIGSLNLKVIILHRDPRGVMNSRLAAYSWCRKYYFP